MERKYTGHISRQQKNRLVDLLANDDELRKGKFTNKFTKKEMRERWEIISKELNAIPGAKKTAEQWKRTWKDLKINAKRKNTQIKSYMRGTGGGPPPANILDTVDEAVLNILEPTMLEGDKNVSESFCSFSWESAPSQTTSTTKDLDEGTDHSGAVGDFEDFNMSEEDSVEIDATQNVTTRTKENIENITVKLPKTNKDKTPPSNKNKPKTKILSKKKRLERTYYNTEKLLNLSEKKIKMKQEYYERKLEILKENNNQLCSISESLLQLNNTISELI